MNRSASDRCRPAASVRLCRLSICMLSIVIGPTACAPKVNHISLDELQQFEQELTNVEPLRFGPADLSLAEVRAYTVGPGDVLLLDLIGLESELSRTQIRVRVHGNGQIALPLVGELEVSDLKLDELERAIRAAYVPDFVRKFSVFAELVEQQTTTVVVGGAVAQPGLVTLPRNERNAIYALALAGGFGPGASGQVRVQPINPDRQEVAYDVASINDLRRMLLAEPLESGDMLFVEPAETSQVYMTGLVASPGPIPIPPNSRLSLRRAIATAGGLVDLLEPKQATLWRELPDGRQVAARIDLPGLLAGTTPDIDLKPGDVLDIPHTLETRLRAWAIQNIQFGPFGMTAIYDPIADRRARLVNDNNGGLFQRTLLQALQLGTQSLVFPAAP